MGHVPLCKVLYGDFHKRGGNPIARWFIMEKNDIKDDLGVPP
jgi:hypothetical protein